MKTRNGFVSNSSSASFIVLWRNTQENDKRTLTEILCKMFSIKYDSAKDSILSDFNKDLYHSAEETTVNFIVDNTQILPDNIFKTHVFTSMMNSIEDFGSDLPAFIMHLITTPGLKLINAEVQSDDN